MAEKVIYSGCFGSLDSEVSVGPSDTSEVTLLEKTAMHGLVHETGAQVVAEFAGDFNTAASTTDVNYKIYYGGAEVLEITNHSPPASSPNDTFELKFWVTTRTQGAVSTVSAYGKVDYHDVTDASVTRFAAASSSGVTAATTSGEVAVKVTATWADTVSDSDLDVQMGQFKIEGVGAP